VQCDPPQTSGSAAKQWNHSVIAELQLTGNEKAIEAQLCWQAVV
jgi:hypothetical protein